ncbi:MAG TPA: cob(I)yrinic acid a,c-diamide adenosyltransferase [Candidatus Saccharimonadia bacterium]|nr:cob(I)yrinic acid a,c-diamide adenosyltransferase [Candidatus Saccharimonadia bacterium]
MTSRRELKKPTGLIYIFTGNGKGKTSAALGMLLRGLANGWNVGWISWYKEASWGISEHGFGKLLLPEAQKRLQFFPMGKGFFLKNELAKGGVKIARVNAGVVVDDDQPGDHRRAAQFALEKAAELLPTVDVLFLDEICNAVDDGLLEESAVLELLARRGKAHVVLTGRNASAKLRVAADLVSEIKKEKHPFDTGKLAVKGLDF